MKERFLSQQKLLPKIISSEFLHILHLKKYQKYIIRKKL